MLKRYPVASFFLLAYALSWTGLLSAAALPASLKPTLGRALVLVATFSPSLAGVAMTGALEGLHGVGRLVGGLLKLRAGLGWYLLALFGLGALMLAAVVASAAIRGAPILVYPYHALILLPLFANALFLGGGLGEELGWRGFALPRLQARYSPLLASLILGLFWGLWHLPDFWLSTQRADKSLPLFLLVIIALSVLYTWVYNNTGGSLLIVTLLHAAGNSTSATLDRTMHVAAVGHLPQILLLSLLWVTVLLVLLGTRARLGRRETAPSS